MGLKNVDIGKKNLPRVLQVLLSYESHENTKPNFLERKGCLLLMFLNEKAQRPMHYGDNDMFMRMLGTDLWEST